MDVKAVAAPSTNFFFWGGGGRGGGGSERQTNFLRGAIKRQTSQFFEGAYIVGHSPLYIRRIHIFLAFIRAHCNKDLLTECEVCTGKYCLRFSFPSDEGARSVR